MGGFRSIAGAPTGATGATPPPSADFTQGFRNMFGGPTGQGQVTGITSPQAAPRVNPAPSPVYQVLSNPGTPGGSNDPYATTNITPPSYQSPVYNYNSSGSPMNPVQQGSTPSPSTFTIPQSNPAQTTNNPFNLSSNPYVSNPTGTNTYPQGTQGGLGGATTNYNPLYFGSNQTAQSFANATGGKVTQGNDLVNAPGSPFTLDQLENMVQLPNGLTVNAGQLAGIYGHNYGSGLTDQMLSNELNFGSQNNQPGKGTFTVVNGKVTYDPNGTPQMLGASAPTPNSPATIANTGAANQAVSQGVNPAQFTNSQQGGYTGSITSQYNPFGPMAQQQQQAPQQFSLSQPQFSGSPQSLSDPLFSAAIQQLYGGNPFSMALGLQGNQNAGMLGSLLNLLAGQSGQSNNIGNIFSMLNGLFSRQSSPANGILSPLFWGSQGGLSSLNNGLSGNNPYSSFLYPQFM